MAVRSSWEGFLKLSLISVPVKAVNISVPGRGDIHFNQLHRGCGNRIRYQKVCPVHGEVDKGEIASGYEYEKGQYLEIDPQELKNLKAEQDESINIESFTSPEEIDPLFLSGKAFFLIPDGKAGQKPYALLHQVMQEKNRCAVASVILSGHEETVVIRPVGQLLTMTVLYNENELKKPESVLGELQEASVSAQELKLAGNLVDAATTKKFEFRPAKDHYAERINQFIQAKLAGHKPAQPKHERHAPVINLMDALRKSLDQTKAEAKKVARGSSRSGNPSGRKTG